MKKNRNVPKMRFEGFTENWRQSKLGKVVGIYDGVHQTPKYQDSGIMFLSVKNIATLQSSKYISEEDFKRNYKVYPQENDILMTRIGDVGTTNVVTNNDLKAYYVSLALLKYKSINPYFLSNAIQSDYVQRSLANRTLKTAIPMKINKDEIDKVDIKLPISSDEQARIGSYFSTLDNLITLHQCKYEKLLDFKKSMVYKLFPKEGEVSPEIRFDGFSEEWKRVKLGDVLKQRIEPQKISDEAPLLSFSYAEGVINPEDKKSNKRDFIMIDKYNKIFLRTEKNDIIYNPANVIHGAIHRNKLRTGVVSPIYKIFICQEVNEKYIGERVRTPNFIKQIKKYIEGSVTKLRTLSPDQFLEMIIEIPPSPEEQEKIGDYFLNLDKIINLQEQKVKKLKNIKSSLLNKMFV